jgi:putative peptidoglycan lipid II flippase
MPTFSAQVAVGRLGEMRSSLAASLRGALLLSIPASLGLIILRTPVVALLYQRGEFNTRSTQLVAWALLWFTAGLVGHALVEILSRAFYALHDTKTPVLVGIAAMSLNVGLSYAFSALFLSWGWMPHGGLALANSTATALEAAGLVWIMRRRLAGLEGGYILRGTFQALTAALMMAATLWGWLAITSGEPDWLVVAGGIMLGGLVFIAGSWVLGINEVSHVLKLAWRRLERR